MRDLGKAAADAGAPSPDTYTRTMRWWFALGWPAFVGAIAIVALMLAKPVGS